MITSQQVQDIVEALISNTSTYLVDVVISPGNFIEVEIDKPEGIIIDDCVEITRGIEASLDRDVEDYELTVGSPGLGQPLKVLPQYHKLIGCPVEVLLSSGKKIAATLLAANSKGISVEYQEKQLLEGKKRKELVTLQQDFDFENIKTVKAIVQM